MPCPGHLTPPPKPSACPLPISLATTSACPVPIRLPLYFIRTLVIILDPLRESTISSPFAIEGTVSPGLGDLDVGMLGVPSSCLQQLVKARNGIRTL